MRNHYLQDCNTETLALLQLWPIFYNSLPLRDCEFESDDDDNNNTAMAEMRRPPLW